MRAASQEMTFTDKVYNLLLYCIFVLLSLQIRLVKANLVDINKVSSKWPAGLEQKLMAIGINPWKAGGQVAKQGNKEKTTTLKEFALVHILICVYLMTLTFVEGCCRLYFGAPPPHRLPG
jgi:hypothetical protein